MPMYFDAMDRTGARGPPVRSIILEYMAIVLACWRHTYLQNILIWGAHQRNRRNPWILFAGRTGTREAPGKVRLCKSVEVVVCVGFLIFLPKFHGL